MLMHVNVGLLYPDGLYVELCEGRDNKEDTHNCILTEVCSVYERERCYCGARLAKDCLVVCDTFETQTFGGIFIAISMLLFKTVIEGSIVRLS